MDITKLLSILERRALYFSNLGSLEDPLEGFLNKATVEKFRTLPDNIPESEKEKTKKIIERNLEIIKKARDLLYVSSWHMNKFESAAMWKIYLKSDEGIAIQSTYERLKESFNQTKEDIQIGMVNYIDEDNDQIDWRNVINYALHKRKSFKHEEELRAVIMLPSTQKGIYISVEIEKLIERISVAPSRDTWIHDLLKRIIKRYNLSIEVERSKLFEDPIY